jgi:hypothetical protein
MTSSGEFHITYERDLLGRIEYLPITQTYRGLRDMVGCERYPHHYQNSRDVYKGKR